VQNLKAKVAAALTVAGLGGLTGLALSQDGSQPAKQVADRPVVHTKVIRRTIHVTKHAKPKHPVAAAPLEPTAETGGAAIATGSSGASVEAAPVTTGSSGAGGESVPVTTASSGAGGGGEVEVDDSGGEVEHEGGDD
jgi:hypothetical protein